MTVTITRSVVRTIEASSDVHLSIGLGFVAVLLLIVLLVYKEAVRSVDGPWSQSCMRTLDAVIYPLLLAFAFIMGVRFLDLLLPIL